MKKPVLTALLASALLAGPVLAQEATTTPAPDAPATTPAPDAPAAATPAPAVEPAPAETAPVATTDVAPADGAPDVVVEVPEGYVLTEVTNVTADELKGVDIYDPTDAKVAEIADVAIGDGDAVTGIITDVGGFLGMGEHRISLSPDQIAIYKNSDNDIRAYVSLTKDELKALPTYEEPNQ